MMLYEVRSAGVKSSGMLIRQELIGLKATLKGLADGSVYDVDPAIYDSIPPPPDHVSAILTCLTKSESGHIYSCILNLNEYMPSNGAIALIRDLSSNAKEAKLIRDELTVIIVPRVNIDGFDATISGEPWRYNVDPFCSSSCPPYYGRNQGYDINRYHPYLTDYPLDDPNTPLPDDQNPVPESLNVRALYDMAGGADDVAVVFDLHGQGTPLDANRDLVTGSTLWPTATDTADDLGIRDQFDDVVYSDIPRLAVMSVIEALADGSL